jgi:hypothetical protein
MCSCQKKRRIEFKDSGQRAWFAGYGLELHETNDTVVNYTVAIIETDEQTIRLVPVELIKFV